jgi:hypothetical protein
MVAQIYVAVQPYALQAVRYPLLVAVEALSNLVLSNPHQPNHLPDIFYLLQMPQAVQESIGLRRR